jgi:hypothetical protein
MTTETKQSLLITKKGNKYYFYSYNFNQFDVICEYNNVNNKISKIELHHLLLNRALELGYYAHFTF